MGTIVNTPGDWPYWPDTSISPISYKFVDPGLFFQFYAAGPTQRVDVKNAISGWQEPGYTASGWQTPHVLASGAPHGAARFGDEVHGLVPRTLPLLERNRQSFKAVRRTTGLLKAVDVNRAFTLPARKPATILLDQQQLTAAYPEWTVRGGLGASVRAVYAEAVFTDINNIRHRDSIENGVPKGVYDVFQLDGQHHTLATLSPRTFRYVQLEIQTADGPLTIEKMGSWLVG